VAKLLLSWAHFQRPPWWLHSYS